MTKKYILIALYCSIHFFANAQQTFLKTLGGNGDENIIDVIATNDGNYIIMGQSTSPNNGNFDGMLMKVDTNGNELWTKFIGGNNFDYLMEGLELPNGDLIVVGRTLSYGNGDSEGYLIRTDNQGNLLWTKTFGGTGYDELLDIIATSDGNLLLSGRTNSFGAGAQDMWLVKVTMTGNTIWSKTYGASSNDWMRKHSLRENTAGNYTIIGVSYNTGLPMHNGVLMEIESSTGNVLSSQLYGNSNNDGFNEYLAGNNATFLRGNATVNGISHAWLNEINPSNNTIISSRTFNVSGINSSTNIVKFDDNDLIFAGISNYNTGIGQAYIFKVAPSTGNVLWAKSYGGNNDEIIRNVFKIPSGYLAFGNSDSYGQGNRDIMIIKTDNQGNVNGCSNNITVTSSTITPNFVAVNFNQSSPTVGQNDVSGTTTTTFIEDIICPLFPIANFQINDLCEGDCIDIIDNSTNADTWEWTISGANTGTFTTQNIFNFCFNNAGTTMIQLIVNNAAGSDTLTQSITVTPLPTVDLGSDTALCVGQTVLLDATNLSPVNYLWQDGSTNSTFDVNVTGLYYVSVANSCLTVSDSVNVVVTGDAPTIDLGENVEICLGEEITLDASTLTANTYEWQDGSTNPTFTVTNEGQYRVTAFNNCGQSTDSIFINTIDCNCYIGVPNVFSPSDNNNNTFSPKKGGICDFVNYKFMVFNRWGTLVFETTDFDQSWDGIYNSEAQPQDTYAYVVEYELTSGFSEIIKGSVLLIR